AVPGQSGCYAGNVLQATSSTGATCLDPVAAKLMALLPDPNIAGPVSKQGTPGSFALGSPNYAFPAPVPNDVYSFDARVDHNLNQNNRLFASYSYRHVT